MKKNKSVPWFNFYRSCNSSISVSIGLIFFSGKIYIQRYVLLGKYMSLKSNVGQNVVCLQTHHHLLGTVKREGDQDSCGGSCQDSGKGASEDEYGTPIHLPNGAF